MDKRKIRLLLMLAILFGLMLAPVFYLNSKLEGAGKDPAYHALEVYGRSLSGDTSADEEAIEIYPSLGKVMLEDGTNIFTKQGDDNCWKLDPSSSFKPVVTDDAFCSE